MARRREFRNIGVGLLSSFVSRNNDVYGYWGIGKLYSHMLASKSMILSIDLINEKIEPENNEFGILIFSPSCLDVVECVAANIYHPASYPSASIRSLDDLCRRYPPGQWGGNAARFRKSTT